MGLFHMNWKAVGTILSSDQGEVGEGRVFLGVEKRARQVGVYAKFEIVTSNIHPLTFTHTDVH